MSLLGPSGLIGLDPPITPQQAQQAALGAAKHSYIVRVLIGLDQLGAAILGFENDQTISSQSEIDAHKKVWYSAIAKALSDGLDLIEKSHGQKAQVGDIERAKEVIATDTAALAQEQKQ